VRHSVRYRLGYADVVAWFAERGLVVDRRLHLPLGPAVPPPVRARCSHPPATSWHEVAGRRNVHTRTRHVDVHVPCD
jgi:hypothetical protein